MYWVLYNHDFQCNFVLGWKSIFLSEIKLKSRPLFKVWVEVLKLINPKLSQVISIKSIVNKSVTFYPHLMTNSNSKNHLKKRLIINQPDKINENECNRASRVDTLPNSVKQLFSSLGSIRLSNQYFWVCLDSIINIII